MRRSDILLLSDETNAVVLRLPERKFPGVLIQGDTLWTVYQHASEVYGRLRAEAQTELAWSAFVVVERLYACLTAYERALASQSIELPYARQVTGNPPPPPEDV